MLFLIAAASLTLSTADHHGQHGQHDHHQRAAEQVSSTVGADVRAVDTDNRTALVQHEALTELGMGAMMMRFAVAEGVDIDLFTPGASLTITVVNGENGFEIIAAEASDA